MKASCNDDSWDQQFLASFDSESTTSGVASDPEEEEEELQPPQPKVRNFCEAIANLEDVKEFLDSKGHVVEATMISSAVGKLATSALQKSTELPRSVSISILK